MTTNKKTTTKQESETPAKTGEKETKVKVKITRHRTRIGHLIAARGAIVTVTKDQADQLYANKCAEFAGV